MFCGVFCENDGWAMVMFNQMERESREELIRLYEAYIENPKDNKLEDWALDCEHKYCGVPVLSKIVSNAGFKATFIALKELPIKEAEEILRRLKE